MFSDEKKTLLLFFVTQFLIFTICYTKYETKKCSVTNEMAGKQIYIAHEQHNIILRLAEKFFDFKMRKKCDLQFM